MKALKAAAEQVRWRYPVRPNLWRRLDLGEAMNGEASRYGRARSQISLQKKHLAFGENGMACMRIEIGGLVSEEALQHDV